MEIEDSLINDINDLVDKHTGEELWKNTVHLAVKRNPKIAQEVLLTIRDNREIRETAAALPSKSTNEHMRQTVRIPQSVDDLLCIVDPDSFPMSQHKKDKALKIMTKLHRALPEFFIVDRV